MRTLLAAILIAPSPVLARMAVRAPVPITRAPIGISLLSVPRLGAGKIETFSLNTALAPSLLIPIPTLQPATPAIKVQTASPTPTPASSPAARIHAAIQPARRALKPKRRDSSLRRLYSGTPSISNNADPVPGAESQGRSRLRKAAVDVPRMLDLARRVMKRKAARRFLRTILKEELEVSAAVQKEFALPDRIKEPSLSQIVLLLKHNPDSWGTIEEYLQDVEPFGEIDAVDEKDERYRALKKKWTANFKAMLKKEEVLNTFRKLNDPLEPMELEAPDDRPGYRNAELYASHAIFDENGKEVPASNLKQVLIDFIAGAKTNIKFNVFEYDLEDLNEAFLAAADRGVKISGGIDKNVVLDEKHAEVKALFDALNAHENITMHLVDSVNLNHQKLIVSDYDDPINAKALFSSANFTQSGMGPEGDLVEIPAEERPEWSVPNANHMVVMDSFLAAQVIATNLTLLLEDGLRGQELPLGGAFKVLGPDHDKDGEEDYAVITFSPRGGLGHISRDVIRRVILNTRGPLRFLQFVFSSEIVYEALLERARLEIAEGGNFDFKSIGDTPFALRPWSMFLKLSGYILRKTGFYAKNRAPALRKILGEEAYTALIDNIRIAPSQYDKRWFKREGKKSIYVSGILHHKLIVSGIVTLFMSFNVTDSAESNNEHVLLMKSPRMARKALGLFDGLYRLTDTSVAKETLAENAHQKEKHKSKREKRRGRVSEAAEKEASKKS